MPDSAWRLTAGEHRPGNLGAPYASPFNHLTGGDVLEEFQGVPTHPLLVHAAVVLVPLLVLVTIVYAALPFARPHTRWGLGLLAIAAPGAAVLAKLSGEAFYARLEKAGRISGDYVARLKAHEEFGDYTAYASIALGVLALALVIAVRPRTEPTPLVGGRPRRSGRGLSVALGVLSVAAAVVAAYYVVRTGDSGAKSVWEGS
jgi:hypothetical protein